MELVGSTIDNKYEILKLIGKGGMSRIYLAMDKRLNKQWAIKVMEIRSDYDYEVVKSAISEANMMKKLEHPAIPRVVDIIESNNMIYIVMDYIEGESLLKMVETYGAQPQNLVIEWAKQICDVLGYLHSRNPHIIYRDMKPGNIMLKPDGNLKIIDFGIAREFKERNIADTVCLGTKGYAAPEQFGGSGQTDARTDIYGFGVTLYHLITGQNPCEPPYELYPITYWNSQLSCGLQEIILKCTRLNPNERYQSCAEVLYALDHYEIISNEIIKNNKRIRIRKKTLSIIGIIAKSKKRDRFNDYKYLIDSTESVNIAAATYFADILASIQKDEKKYSSIKGPTYDDR